MHTNGHLRFVSSIALIIALVIGGLGLPIPPVKAADAAAIQNADIPEGLSSGEWRSIREMARQTEYQLSYHEADGSQPAPYYWAPNRAQGWDVVFAPSGLELTPQSEDADWHLGLALRAYGYGGRMRSASSAPTLSADADRLTYQWSDHLSEWYVNAADGLEHGFTLAQPPGVPTGEALQIDLAVLGILGLRQTGGGIDFEDSTGQAIARYDQLHVLDAVGHELPAQLQAMDGTIRIAIDDANAVYPLTITMLTTEIAKLTASDGAANDEFGNSVSISGDTIVVGASGDDSSQGAAYVFTRNQGGADAWDQATKLTASDGVATDEFGNSVSISGDTIVVGAYKDDVGSNIEQGSAYVFARNQGGADTWGQVAKLTASDGATSDQFGTSVSISNDTLVVGASYDDLSYGNEGSAYVFARNQGGADNWGQVTKLTASDSASTDLFGNSVSISGDTLVVGAYWDDVGSNANQGSAYVFARNQGGVGNWGQVIKLTASDGAASDDFGNSVSIGDDTLVVGALYDDDSGNSSGSAYVFARNQGGPDNWGQVTKLTASDGAALDNFGYAVSISGDALVVGAYGDDDSGNASGSAYAFARNEGGIDNWGQVIKLTASDGTAGDLFGSAVSISSDTLVVGAYGDDSSQGSAYTFTRDGGSWLQHAHPIASDGAVGDYFGGSISINGDTLVVGAYGDDTSQGSAYVFTRNQGSADNWGQVTKLTASDGAAVDTFGYAVSIGGDTLIVGAPTDDDSGNASGSAYVFARNQGGADAWGQVTKLTAPTSFALDQFGTSVSISGDTLVVGARGKSSYRGAAYVFARNQGGADNWGYEEVLIASDGEESDEFGHAVSISGDTIVVGAYRDDASQGSAYVFARNQGGVDNWGQVAKLTASDGEENDQFGSAVSISDDTLVVGAGGHDVGSNANQGSAYVFARNQGGIDNWGQVINLTASDGATSDWFGNSVSISNDTLVVGAIYDDDNGVLSGSAYVFARNQDGTDAWGQVIKLTASDGEAWDRFGASVSISGDMIVSGAPESKVNGTNQGSAYVFRRQDALAETIAGLQATNNSPMPHGNVTTLTATITVGTNVFYSWAFGDGETGNGAVVDHSYPAGGYYTATVTASNSQNTITATTTVTITTSCWVRLNDEPIGYTTIQDAVDASTQATDIIKVAGTCYGASMREGLAQTVYLSKTLTIQGGYTTTNWTTPDPVAHPTVLDAQEQGRVLYITGNIEPTIEGLNLTNGDADGLGGGGQFGDEDSGGGVYILAATATISGCQVYNNTAETGGGVYLRESDTTITQSDIYANTAVGQAGGGLVLSGGQPTISGNSIYSNTVYGDDGGGLFSAYSTPTISGNEIISNTADEGGGGVFLLNCDGATISQNTIGNNTAGQSGEGDGGGLFIEGGDGVTISRNMISNNIAGQDSGGSGGGLLIGESDNVTISRNTIISNTALYDAVLDGGGEGGGLLTDGSSVALDHNLFSGNQGGAATVWFVESNATLDGDRVIGNLNGDGSDDGYGIAVEGSIAAMTNTVITDNQGPMAEGGGIIVYASEVHLLHATIARNSGPSGVFLEGEGGYGYSTLAMTNTILVDHTVGISVTAGNTTTVNGVLWHNTPTTVSQDTGTTVWVQNEHTGDPVFASDGYHLTDGSAAAIDQGVDAGIAVDLDGDPRPTFSGYDLGADEFVPVVPIAGLQAVNDGPTLYGNATTLTATVTAGTNVAYTWAFGDGDVGSGAVVQHSYPAAGTYTATVTASNSQNTLTATTTVTIYDVAIVVPGGGPITTTDSVLTLESPPEMAGTLTFTYAPTVSPTQSTGTMQTAGVTFNLSAYDAAGQPVHTLSPPLTLTVHYDESSLSVGVDEEDLDLYRWDEGSGQWVALTVLDRDTAADTITVALDHLTEFALLVQGDRKVYLPLVMRGYP